MHIVRMGLKLQTHAQAPYASAICIMEMVVRLAKWHYSVCCCKDYAQALCLLQSISGSLPHCGKTKILTDQSNARYAETLPSTANLISQFSFSFSFHGTSNLNRLIEMVLAAWLHPRKEVE